MPKRKKKKNIKPYLILFFVLALLLVYIIYIYIKQTEAKFAVYPGFEIELPLGYQIHGIDISKHNGYVYWPAVASMKVKDVKVGFVFMKATEGSTLVDAQFKRNWQQAKDVNMPRGAYHFFLSYKSGEDQAKNFLNTVKLEKGDLPPVLDIESLHNADPAAMRSQLMLWLKLVEKSCGAKPIVYTNVDFYKNYLEGYFNDYPLWVAHYFADGKPDTNAKWVFWQHSETGKMNGIKSAVDFNVFKGDSSDFKKLLLK
jgi:lysozyme